MFLNCHLKAYTWAALMSRSSLSVILWTRTICRMEQRAMFDVMEFAHLDILHVIMPLSIAVV